MSRAHTPNMHNCIAQSQIRKAEPAQPAAGNRGGGVIAVGPVGRGVPVAGGRGSSYARRGRRTCAQISGRGLSVEKHL